MKKAARGRLCSRNVVTFDAVRGAETLLLVKSSAPLTRVACAAQFQRRNAPATQLSLGFDTKASSEMLLKNQMPSSSHGVYLSITLASV